MKRTSATAVMMALWFAGCGPGLPALGREELEPERLGSRTQAVCTPTGLDSDDACGAAQASSSPVLHSPPSLTDVNGDGRMDACGRGPDGFRCHLATEEGFDEGAVLRPLTDASGWLDAPNHSSLRMGDIDGDRKADLCALSNSGIQCWTSETTPLGTPVQGPEWKEETGWSAVAHYSTLRLLDLNADGKEDLCARAAVGLVCHLSTGSGFGPGMAGPEWSNGAGFDLAKSYATLRTGDFTGDGNVDLCIRSPEGMECVVSTGTGFGNTVKGPRWSDAASWDNRLYYNSIQLVDVNGDRKADLCARAAKGLVCHFSSGTAFGDEVLVAPISNDSGWADLSNALTLRAGDLDGDGAIDFCARDDERVRCWAWGGNSFVEMPGPGLSDASGWAPASHSETLRLGDANGDGRADLCARANVGWSCADSRGDSFTPIVGSAAFSSAAGWGAAPYYGSLFFGGNVVKAVPLPPSPLPGGAPGEEAPSGNQGVSGPGAGDEGIAAAPVRAGGCHASGTRGQGTWVGTSVLLLALTVLRPRRSRPLRA